MATSIGRVSRALALGTSSQLQPAMLGLLWIPFVCALVGWGLTAWLAWTPLTQWLQRTVFDGVGVLHWLGSILEHIGIHDFGGWGAAAVALLLLVPLMFTSAMALIAVLAMPVVTHRLGAGPYRDVERRGRWSTVTSIGNAVGSFALFALGYIVTMPLWLIPPLALIVPWLWWSWVTARMMRFDSLVEHADGDERRALIASYRREYFMMALVVSALNYIPPLFLITPVLSALVFVHYSLSRLRESRGESHGVVRIDHHR